MDKTSDGERNDKRGSPTEPVTPISSSAYDPPSKTSTFSNESYGTTSAKPIVEDAKPKSSQSHSNPVKMTQKADLTNLSTKIVIF